MKKHKVDKTHRMDGTKLLWHMDRVHKFYRDGERIAPLYIDIGVTKKCNISCISFLVNPLGINKIHIDNNFCFLL